MCSTVLVGHLVHWWLTDSTWHQATENIAATWLTAKENMSTLSFVQRSIGEPRTYDHHSKQKRRSRSSHEATTQNPHLSFQFCKQLSFHCIPIFSQWSGQHPRPQAHAPADTRYVMNQCWNLTNRATQHNAGWMHTLPTLCGLCLTLEPHTRALQGFVPLVVRLKIE